VRFVCVYMYLRVCPSSPRCTTGQNMNIKRNDAQQEGRRRNAVTHISRGTVNR